MTAPQTVPTPRYPLYYKVGKAIAVLVCLSAAFFFVFYAANLADHTLVSRIVLDVVGLIIAAYAGAILIAPYKPRQTNNDTSDGPNDGGFTA